PPRTRQLAKLDAGLAAEIGARIRAQRSRAGLTQAELAEGRYTKAYISALEHGLAKPSMAALGFIASRLGISAASLLGAGAPAWTRLEADLRLASGDWLAAVDAYSALLEGETDRSRQAELWRGLAEASCRLERSSDALQYATAAASAFAALGRPADAFAARYWASYALLPQGNEREARSILRALLDQLRGGLVVEPGFTVRLLIAMAMVDSYAGQPAQSLSYLDEARALVGDLDDRRQATFLTSLAISYREHGDLEAAIGLANQALARFAAAEGDREIAVLENELALTHLGLGSTERARSHAALADERFQRLSDDFGRAHVVESKAQIELAAGAPAAAAELAAEARELADRTGNHKAYVSAGLTLARAHRALGDLAGAAADLERAAERARLHQRTAQLRTVLTEWADLLASEGDVGAAYELTREALALSAR
ncbi:MAG: tetratricopeptide repeat protein, partial [Candidatus Limnocylindrales bacterium]